MIGHWEFRVVEDTNNAGDPVLRLEFRKQNTTKWNMLIEAVVDGTGILPLVSKLPL